MSEHRFDVRKLNPDGVRALVEALALDEEHIRSVAHDAASSTLVVELAEEADPDPVAAFVADMARTQRKLVRKIRRETGVPEEVADIDAALADSPHLVRLGDGLCGLRGPLLGLFRYFEAEFTALARAFGAEEHHYPVMVPTSVLGEVGYFDHFPQHATFCSHLRGSLPVLESVSADVRAGARSLGEILADNLREPGHVLTPAVCLPCYRLFRDVTLEAGAVRTITMQNQVFRYEAAGFRPLARAWDFTVRDIVFFGEATELEELREEVMQRALALCERLALSVAIELANDPFFLDASRSKAMYQRMSEVKYELTFPIPHRGERLAASSFNLHRTFYTGVFRTRRADGATVESACMGFGLERWVYGFLTQKGLDPAGWPEEVRAFVAR